MPEWDNKETSLAAEPDDTYCHCSLLSMTINGGHQQVQPFCDPLDTLVGVKVPVPLEAARHATPQQSKRHRLLSYKKTGMAI